MKNQVSIEYLGTFGWILLVVLVAILTLSYFGVFDISNQLPEDCYFGEQIKCSNQFVDERGNLVLSLESNLNKDITITDIVVEGYDMDVNDCSSNLLRPNTPVNIICILNPDSPGTVFDEERQRFLVTLDVQPEGSPEIYELKGTVFTDVLELDLSAGFSCEDLAGPSADVCEKEYQCDTWNGAIINEDYLGQGFCCDRTCIENYCVSEGYVCCESCSGTKISGEQYWRSCQEVESGMRCCNACKGDGGGGDPDPIGTGTGGE